MQIIRYTSLVFDGKVSAIGLVTSTSQLMSCNVMTHCALTHIPLPLDCQLMHYGWLTVIL